MFPLDVNRIRAIITLYLPFVALLWNTFTPFYSDFLILPIFFSFFSSVLDYDVMIWVFLFYRRRPIH